MRICTVLFVSIAASTLVAGCGSSPRLDATTQETFKASTEKVEAGMSEQEKREFQRDLATVTMVDRLKDMGKTGAKATTSQSSDPMAIYKPVDGLTAWDVHEKAVAARDSTRKPLARP